MLASTYIPKRVSVFISHCGKDTKDTFVAALVEKLKAVNITTFVDEDDLHAAESANAWEVMKNELKKSRIQVCSI